MTEAVPEIVLTNDDGIDSPGLRALHHALSDIGDVTVVAPSNDNSGMGRVLSLGRSAPVGTGEDPEPISVSSDASARVEFSRREIGYAVDGTPADCVVAAVSALDIAPDFVVSGCNLGPNSGASVFGRSGTVSAAIEAAYLGVPGIAVSSTCFDTEQTDFDFESSFTRRLVRFLMTDDVFDDVDYLNTLVPPEPPERVVVTEPAQTHEVSAEIADSGGAFELTLDHLRKLYTDEGNWAEGTDRRAVARNHASISPLELPNGPVDSAPLERFVSRYEESVVGRR